MAEQGRQGVLAVENKNYDEAVRLLDRALATSNNPAWLLARSQAHQHLGRPDLALRDAEAAYHAAAARASGATRKLMTDAQYRRSVALFHLGRLADADCCAAWSQRLAAGRPAGEDDGVERRVDERGNYLVTAAEVRADTSTAPPGPDKATGALLPDQSHMAQSRDWNRAYIWRSQVLHQMEKLPPDHPGRKVRVTKVPPLGQETKKTDEKQVQKKEVEEKQVEKDAEKAGKAPEPTPKLDASAPSSHPPEANTNTLVTDEQLRCRSAFYQTASSANVTLFVKNADPQKLNVHFGPKEVVVGPIPRPAAPFLPHDDLRSYSTLELEAPIQPGPSRYAVTPNKIEFVLQKREPGRKWAHWGTEKVGQLGGCQLVSGSLQPVASPATTGGDSAADETPSSSTATRSGTAAAAAQAARPPAYPTSSKGGPKNWDRLVGEDGDEDEEKQDVDSFFKQLYANATPDQQRAMMKSFLESNGTTLSTDWDDVGKRKVETVPPDGVEAKKW